MMLQCAVIVDFSFLFHLAKSSALNTPPEYDLKDVTIQNVVGKLRTIKKELAKQNIVGYDLVFVEDRPALRKLALMPSYREGHKDTREEKQDVKNYLLSNGHITRFCWSEGNEADDSIATVTNLALEERELFVIICTGDKDLWQMIGPRVTVFNPVKRFFVTKETVVERFKCQPIHIPLHKALFGDAGDCVPNVMPRTQRQMLPIINQTSGCIEDFHQKVNENKYSLTDKCYSRYLEVKNEIDRNFSLVKLDPNCELIWE